MTDFPLVAMIAHYGSFVAMSLAIMWIVRTDLIFFEISFGGCAILTLSGLVVATAGSGTGFGAVRDGLIAGAIAGLVAALVHVFMPARLGRGDIVLLASMGAVTGTALMPALMVLFFLLCVVTAAFYSLRRGKRLFRSAFPAALPAMAALIPVLAWRHGALVMPLLAATVATNAHALVIAGQGWLELLSWRSA